MSVGRRRQGPRYTGGFTYLGLIVLLAIIGLVGAATLKVDALLRRAAAEEELLETGAMFSAALRSYADATPRGQPPQPLSLQDLLKDPRYPGVRRHLRKIFIDPMSGKPEWGIVYSGGSGSAIDNRAGNGIGHSGRILAVYSLSAAKPLKIANFDVRFQNFENKEHVSEWKFAATGLFPDRRASPAPNSDLRPAQAQATPTSEAPQSISPVATRQGGDGG